ncbi:hypothetical protein CE195_12570 [Sodalis-like symbiont of Philaenus spumarius]|nr:hypothetical protein CE195_12570 [Sodalis-like symbiont of Philaenus spumarius]
MTFSAYPDIRLAEARQRHVEAKSLLRQGINPTKEKSHQTATHKNTFRSVALPQFPN